MTHKYCTVRLSVVSLCDMTTARHTESQFIRHSGVECKRGNSLTFKHLSPHSTHCAAVDDNHSSVDEPIVVLILSHSTQQ